VIINYPKGTYKMNEEYKYKDLIDIDFDIPAYLIYTMELYKYVSNVFVEKFNNRITLPKSFISQIEEEDILAIKLYHGYLEKYLYTFYIHKNGIFYNYKNIEFEKVLIKKAYEDLGTYKIYFYFSKKATTEIPNDIFRLLLNFLYNFDTLIETVLKFRNIFIENINS